ncbi:hypothetical protein Gasu2_49930 [Galdieria sulphuraria]|uniref:Uncharacterized protein n=1 Tax=Galdieria sulphuraria TaxID=130081 RepID=M2Y4I0_GALSU|nr:uncharacterized protein Gasu_19880 [Galdieria sulphuraria]EME30749.1 hypothetical protein Gasu_19880 [Galdieria sulphuraria]GJD10823.1 hypothetical protein Gasu2_49930 [Galdieria sulphuraria]|eukprot:XP_005707269.1 hypothetical protein Gasu_19880 [Galdieria sulphuraria]
MGALGFFQRTLSSGRNKEVYPLLACVSLSLVMATFLSVDQLLHNPSVVWKKSEREAFARNELEKKERWSLLFLRKFREHPVTIFDPLAFHKENKS